MTAPKTKYPIESFGPELMAALLKGGREPVLIPFEGPLGKKTAHNFQRRIHTLRRRMREENHPQYMVATRARVSLFWGEKAAELDPKRFESLREDYDGKRGAVIVIRPHDTEFASILNKAGIEVDGVQIIPQLEETIPDTTPSPTLEDLLSDLDKGKPS